MRRLLKWVGTLLLVLLIVLGVLWFILFRPPPAGTPATATVTTSSGLVRGLEEQGVTVYRGIPYAAPPVGELRWREPQAVPSWSGTRNAFGFSKACPQIGGPVPGLPPEPTDEDCLYLNVWRPTAPDQASLPVIVWVHGGSNTNGSASAPPYGGANLARKGAIVVSINYRLGALGFLAHPWLSAEAAYGTSGNYGMLDIVAALRWVRDNAAAFGGDPANVTVMGHSAGAWNVSHLQVSPLARGLYRRIIAMSGGNFGPPDTRQGAAVLSTAEQAGVTFARRLGARSLGELRALPAERIVAAQAKDWPSGGNAANTHGIIDGHVVPRAPYSGHRAGEAHLADLLVGYTSAEGINWASASVTMAAYQADVTRDYGHFSDEILALYPASSDEVATRSNQRLTGERAFKWQVATWAREHARARAGNVWFYRFSHTTGIGPFRSLGPGHGAELGHVFDFPRRGLRWGTQWPWNARRDIALIDTLQTYWINFARSGNPNGPGLPVWPEFGQTARAIELGEPPRAIAFPDTEEHRLMDRYMNSLRSATQAQPVGS